jgi:carbonic anhydrase/acetyltransferase-like protein (isoleucine patch superfamily)
MLLEYDGKQPDIPEETYIAPNAIIRGDVTIGKGTSVLFGAVITAEGGPVTIGENCVIMEQAVIRGTPKHPAKIGHSVLVGPQSHLSGCKIDDEVFIATGSTIFNGVHIKQSSEVRINGVVHVNSVLEPESMVPIGWIAVGNPAEIFPPTEHKKIWEIQKEMDFPRTVWGVDRATVSQGERIHSYAKALQRHRDDKIISKA